MIKEHDIIKHKGLFGTVIHIYPGEKAYVVEFINPGNGKSNVKTLLKDQIEEVNYESKSINKEKI